VHDVCNAIPHLQRRARAQAWHLAPPVAKWEAGTPADTMVAMTDIRLGALPWNQCSDWPALLRASTRADELGYDALWTLDHVCPISGDPRGPTAKR
jgi:hypothetical protein